MCSACPIQIKQDLGTDWQERSPLGRLCMDGGHEPRMLLIVSIILQQQLACLLVQR